MAKKYNLYAMVYSYYDRIINSVNSSYYTENMASAQAMFEEDLKARGMVPLNIMSEAQVKKKVYDYMRVEH